MRIFKTKNKKGVKSKKVDKNLIMEYKKKLQFKECQYKKEEN